MIRALNLWGSYCACCPRALLAHMHTAHSACLWRRRVMICTVHVLLERLGGIPLLADQLDHHHQQPASAMGQHTSVQGCHVHVQKCQCGGCSTDTREQ